VTAGQGTAIVAANTHVITPAGPLEEMVILVNNTFAGAKVFTVVAGDNPPADAAGLGALTVSVAQDAVMAIGPLSSARFLQSNGTLQITVAAGTTGFIQPLQVPRV